MTDFLGNIKPDREERPKVDAIYQDALSPIKQQRGCPLTFCKNGTRKLFWRDCPILYKRPEWSTEIFRYSEDRPSTLF